MAVKKLLRIGDPRLLTTSSVVDDIGDPKIQAIIDDLIDSMRHYGGVGIAAPQIGYFVRIFIIELDHNQRYPDMEPVPLTVLINPEIEILSDEREEGWEGCLSVPGYRGLVPRSTHVRYSGYDREGGRIEREVTGFHARSVQHENDHIDGILFPMRIEDMRNFGCEDQLWEQITGQPYPESLKEKVRALWNL
jgi:peptide deformylase